MTAIKDSGERQQFSTGAQRDTQTLKGRFDLIPYEALCRIAQVFEAGAEKYEDRNWEKGMPVSRFINSAMRHLAKAAQGYTDEPHLAQAGWNICCAIATAERAARGFLPVELLDIPSHLEDFNPSWLEGEIPAYTKEGLRVDFQPEDRISLTPEGERVLRELAERDKYQEILKKIKETRERQETNIIVAPFVTNQQAIEFFNSASNSPDLGHDLMEVTLTTAGFPSVRLVKQTQIGGTPVEDPDDAEQDVHQGAL